MLIQSNRVGNMSEEKTGTSKKAHRLTREIRHTRPLTKFEMANNAILKMYDATVAVLQEGIRQGTTNTPLGIISFMAYIDLLHGGAYAVPINQLPFFLEDKTKSPYYTGPLKNADMPQGAAGWLGSIFGGLNAGPLFQETMENANAPHIFPKLLSDQMYGYLKGIFAWFTSTELLKEAGTGVTTFVAAGAKALEAVGKLEESTGKAIQSATPSAEQINALMPLLALMGV